MFGLKSMQHIYAPDSLPELRTPLILIGSTTLSSAMTVGPAFGETTPRHLPETLSAILWCRIDVHWDSSTNKPLTDFTYSTYLLNYFTSLLYLLYLLT